MVNYDLQLDNAFRALGDKTRRAILQRLTTGDALVSELAQPFSISLPAISKHLVVLETAGLISRHTQGRKCLCHLEEGVFRQLSDWLDFYQKFWDIRLDNLSEFLETNSK